MLFPIVVLLWTAVVFASSRYLATKRDGRALWRSAVTIGVTVGLLRGGFASAGWYGVEHTGGPLQVPAFALAMLAWPEAALLPRHRGPTQPSVYPLLVLVLTASSAAGAALLVQITRGRPDGWRSDG